MTKSISNEGGSFLTIVTANTVNANVAGATGVFSGTVTANTVNANTVVLATSLTAPVFNGNATGNLATFTGVAGVGAIIGVPSTTPASMLHVEGSIYASGDIVGLSDLRKKTDLVRIDSAIEKIDALNGYTFRMLDSSTRRAGLIAQDCLAVLPESVFVNPDDGTMGVAYASLTGLFVEGIKELAAEIRELKARFDVL